MTTLLVALGNRATSITRLATLVVAAVLIAAPTPAHAASTRPAHLLAQGAGMGTTPSSQVRDVQRELQRRGGTIPVVFITAHDRHAVDAFELNALDYLLKPVRASRLAAALKKEKKRVPTKPSKQAKENCIEAKKKESVVKDNRKKIRYIDH